MGNFPAEYLWELSFMGNIYIYIHVVGSKSLRPDQIFKVTEIKQLCYFFNIVSLYLLEHTFSTDTLTSP